MQQPSYSTSRRSECGLYAAGLGSGGGTTAYVDSRLDAALDYSWSLPPGERGLELEKGGARGFSPRANDSGRYASYLSLYCRRADQLLFLVGLQRLPDAQSPAAYQQQQQQQQQQRVRERVRKPRSFVCFFLPAASGDLLAEGVRRRTTARH